MLITKIAQDTANLAKTRENFDDMHLPRGNCPNCGKQFRTPKDTKVSWFWVGYMAGQGSIITFLRKRKDAFRKRIRNE